MAHMAKEREIQEKQKARESLGSRGGIFGGEDNWSKSMRKNNQNLTLSVNKWSNNDDQADDNSPRAKIGKQQSKHNIKQQVISENPELQQMNSRQGSKTQLNVKAILPKYSTPDFSGAVGPTNIYSNNEMNYIEEVDE